MAGVSPLECGVCNENFNEDTRCPRILPCYHHLCSCCIDRMIENDDKSCPFCRRPFKAEAAKDIRINTGVLDLVIFISKQSGILQSKEEDEDESIGLVYATENKSNCLLRTCRDVEHLAEGSIKDLKELMASIRQQNDTISIEIINYFNNIMAMNDERIDELEAKESMIREHQTTLKEKEDEMVTLKENLRTEDDTFTEDEDIRMAVEDANDAISASIKLLKNIFSQEDRLCLRVAEDMRLTDSKTETVLKVIQGETQEYDGNALSAPSAPPMDFPEQVQPLGSGPEQVQAFCSDARTSMAVGFKAMNIGSSSDDVVSSSVLMKMTPYTLNQIEKGLMYAVQFDGCKKRYARISLDKLMHLHCLQDESPPKGATLVEHGELLRHVTTEQATVFLDLDDSYSLVRNLGKVYISLLSGLLGAENFRLLCTGEKGPSYISSVLLDVIAKGTNRETIHGGDYEYNSGKGGKTLVKGLDLGDKNYFKSWQAGVVRGVSFKCFGQFYINTRDREPGTGCHGSIGKVSLGLDILRRAIKRYDNVKMISIQDCGMVLPNKVYGRR